MKVIRILLLILPYWVVGQYSTTIFIDPDWTGTESGTKLEPYNSWHDFSIQSNTAYLQKRGTIADITSSLNGGLITGADNVKISAYGTGARPIIRDATTGIDYIFDSSSNLDWVISNVEMVGTSTGSYGYGSTAPIHLRGNSGCENFLIENCIFHHFYNCLRFITYGGTVDDITIKNCLIYDATSDGIFASDISNLRVIGTNLDKDVAFTFSKSSDNWRSTWDSTYTAIWRVNQRFHRGDENAHNQDYSDGDCIQLLRSEAGSSGFIGFELTNTVLDRRYAGNKFCFIMNTSVAEVDQDLLIEDCMFWCPKDTTDDDGGGDFYFNGIGNNGKIIVNRCWFVGNDDTRLFDGVGTKSGWGYIANGNYDFIYCTGENIEKLLTAPGLDSVRFFNNSFFKHPTNGGNYLIDDSYGKHRLVNNLIGLNTGQSLYIYGTNLSETYSNKYTGSSANWDTQLGIVDWDGGDFHKTANSNDGQNLNIPLDFDAMSVGNPPEIGAYEYISNFSRVVSGGKPVKVGSSYVIINN